MKVNTQDKAVQDKERYIKKLLAEKKELIDRIEFKDQEVSNILNYAGVAIIESTADLRIINQIGAIDSIFGEFADKVDRGGNLMILVYKATKSLTQKNVTGEDAEELEVTVNKFIESSKDETDFNIIGNKKDVIFLLTWRILRIGNHFRHYFKITPTNTIVNEAKNEFDKNIDNYKMFYRQIFDEMHDGITIINRNNKIEMINESAKKMFLPGKNKIISRTNLEGKYFNELFLNEDADKARHRVEMHNEALASKKTKVYELTTFDKLIRFKAIPNIDNNGDVSGILLVSTLTGQNETVDNEDKIELLQKTIKTLNDSSKAMKKRIKELEYNHKWFMNKRREDSHKIRQFHKTIKAIYTYLENLPISVSIQTFPSFKYEFINKEFERKTKKNRSDILGYTDKDLCTKQEYKTLTELNKRSKDRDKPVKITSDDNIIKQTFLKDESDNITHILRVYYKISGEAKNEQQ